MLENLRTGSFRGMEFLEQLLISTRDFLKMESIMAKERQLGILEMFTKAVIKMEKKTDMAVILPSMDLVMKEIGFRASAMAKEYKSQQMDSENRSSLTWTKNRLLKYHHEMMIFCEY